MMTREAWMQYASPSLVSVRKSQELSFFEQQVRGRRNRFFFFLFHSFTSRNPIQNSVAVSILADKRAWCLRIHVRRITWKFSVCWIFTVHLVDVDGSLWYIRLIRIRWQKSKVCVQRWPPKSWWCENRRSYRLIVPHRTGPSNIYQRRCNHLRRTFFTIHES